MNRPSTSNRKGFQMLALPAIVLTLLTFPCSASENGQNETGKEADSPRTSNVENTPDSNIVIPAPSISADSPSFQTSLTKLIRTKGHADQAKKKGEFKKAKKLYLRCIKDPKVNHRSLGFCYRSLAQIYDKEGNKADARKYYGLALQEMKKHKMKRQIESLQKTILEMNAKDNENKSNKR